MKRVTRIQTSDGNLHDGITPATRHAEARYGVHLSKLAHQLLQRDKYMAMQEFIDANLPAFEELSALKADIIVDTEQE